MVLTNLNTMQNLSPSIICWSLWDCSHLRDITLNGGYKWKMHLACSDQWVLFASPIGGNSPERYSDFRLMLLGLLMMLIPASMSALRWTSVRQPIASAGVGWPLAALSSLIKKRRQWYEYGENELTLASVVKEDVTCWRSSSLKKNKKRERASEQAFRIEGRVGP